MSESIADTLKCPHCAANLVYDATLNKAVCNFCGSEFDPSMLKLIFTFENREEDEEIEDDTRQEITCNSCGATVITDENTSATFCYYCGSPALAGSRLRREFKPDYIIPFKLTREEAGEKFMQWGRENKYVPSDFMDPENIKKLTPLYVPFWLVDSKCHAQFFGTGTSYSSQRSEKIVFSLEREVDFRLKRVPFVGSKKMNRILMEAVEPFDYSELVPYRDAYLPGFYAERYNLKPSDMAQNVMYRLENYARSSCDVMSSQYDEVRLKAGDIDVSDIRYSYALLPVWFLNYQKDGVYHGFAINGQTGEACGMLPYSKKKRTMALTTTVLLWLVLPMILLTLLVIGLRPEGKGSELLIDVMTYLYYAIFFVATGVVYVFIKKFRKKRIESRNPIDKAPDLSEYYDATQKTDLKHKDERLGVYPLDDNESYALRHKKLFKFLDKIF